MVKVFIKNLEVNNILSVKLFNLYTKSYRKGNYRIIEFALK